jgi:hypothetical protein
MKLTGSSDPSSYNEKVRQDYRCSHDLSQALLGSLRIIRVLGIWGFQTTLQDWSPTLLPKSLILSQVSIVETFLYYSVLM